LWRSDYQTESESTMPQSIVQPLRRWDPERIGSYAIIGRLGAGAMGQVFLARSTAGRLVAVKTIRVELAEEAGFRARFAREVAAASRVSGVFTAAVIEAAPDADLPWVATAYVPAPSLSALVKRAGPLPVPAVRWLAAGCGEALQSIHGAGLLHRDVKPSNVLVAADGPRVIDFGVARAAERVQLTTTRGAAGTPAYMAPEQARDATQASPASDVFSLGATLVYAATGHPPYQGETVMDILVRLATEPPDLTGVPGELMDLITACLQRVPRDRPSDVAILGTLGSFAQPAGSGHVYLPESAMAVIAEYLAVAEFQHLPRLAVPLATDGEDPDDEASAGSETHDSGVSIGTNITNGSHTPLPGFESLAAFPQDGPAPADLPAGRWSPGPPEPNHGSAAPAGQAPGPHPVRRRRRRASTFLGGRVFLPLWARALVALVLIGAGVGLGVELRGSGAQAAAGSTTAAGNTTAAGSAAAVGNTGGPGGLPPASCTTIADATGPEICVSQPLGDGYTVFIIHGTGFPRFRPVTVRLDGVGVAPDRPVADLQGTFSYAIDQGQVFFRGPIPPGTYHVVVTSASGQTAEVSFIVNAGATGVPPPPQPGAA
jgi:serine/threonine protein kinase